MRQVPPVPSKARRPPLHRVRPAPPSSLARSYTQLPTLNKWRADTARDRIAGRANDPVLRSIDDLIVALQDASDGAEMYLLGQLFFNTLSWLNHYKRNPMMDPTCRKPVLSLNLFASNALALGMECAVGQLAGKLQNLYGVGMSEHGVDTDRKENPKYFDAAKREVYRAFVVWGKVRHYRSGTKRFAILDTEGIYTDGRPGYGFVLSMSNELYIGNFAQMRGTYHSTFMAGRPVQCAGTIELKNGVVTHIKNDSGHYKPVDQSLVKVLQFLRMHGMDISKITVSTAVHARGANEMEASGEVFLRENGNWEGIRARARHQSRL